jgi:hypothetical protein
MITLARNQVYSSEECDEESYEEVEENALEIGPTHEQFRQS